jgi:hypothetical protein
MRGVACGTLDASNSNISPVAAAAAAACPTFHAPLHHVRLCLSTPTRRQQRLTWALCNNSLLAAAAAARPTFHAVDAVSPPQGGSSA